MASFHTPRNNLDVNKVNMSDSRTQFVQNL